jgi:acyl-CoA synthetase (AMP-forming)/AMP-acid ligase II
MIEVLIPWSLDGPDRVALRAADGQELSYNNLRKQVIDRSEMFSSDRTCLVFHFIQNSIEDVIGLFATLAAGHAVALLNPSLEVAVIQDLAKRYEPDFAIGPIKTLQAISPTIGGERDIAELSVTKGLWKNPAPSALPVNALNSVLLSTSGSTGSAKFVRLSAQNLLVNARQIVRALDITQDDVACGHLSLHYSYGLSVLLSHLHAKASILLHDIGFMEAAFWDAARQARCTSLPGVPFHYEMLRRLDLEKLMVPDIKVCTQAGGRLQPKLIPFFSERMSARGGRFYVMYGQTEASPRMTTLAFEDVKEFPDSVGTALSEGRIEIQDEQGQALETGQIGEVVYFGSNVMLGYALDRSDLAKGDVTGGVLRTGDLGRLDERGRLFITGRAARFAKILGLRVSLDEVEKMANIDYPVASLDIDGKLLVLLEGADDTVCQQVLISLSEALSIHPSYLKVRVIDALPRLASGKLDYRALKEAVA